MPTYAEELASSKNFTGNAVIKFGGEYYAIRRPDSGLAMASQRERTIASLVINPTSIDPRRVSTTIGSYSFSLVDRNGIISRAIKDTAVDVLGQDVELWIGRSGVGMSFADYYKMPITRVSKVNKVDCGWAFSTKESTDRMNRPIYDVKNRLSGEIVSGTTIITAKDDISGFPSAGFFRLDSEIISYTSKNDGTKTFSGCARGEFGTIAAAHDDNDDLVLAETVSGNPIDILLKILTSGSGTGSYDTLVDGLGIGTQLIDVADMEALRDELFSGVTFSLALYNIDNALKYIEEQLLAPCNLRLTFSANSLLTVVKLDTAEFIESIDVLDHDNIVDSPNMVIDDTKIVNKISISWDYNEGTGKYNNVSTYQDDDSIDDYGKSISPLNFSFKGVTDQEFVDDFANGLLLRLSTPKPEVEVKAFISKGLLNVGDKGRLETILLPNGFGDLNFASDMEIVNRAINYQTGEVKLKLAYTSYTDVRLGFISPADTFLTINGQDDVEIAAGRGDFYQVGWRMRLWNNALNEYESDAVNSIASITGDNITFEDAWSTTLTTDHRMIFADYDQVVSSQKRYAFACSNDSDDFSVTEKSYKIVP